MTVRVLNKLEILVIMILSLKYFLDDTFFGGYDQLSKQAKMDYLNSFK